MWTYDTASVALGDSFLLVGGYSPEMEADSDRIYEYMADIDSWRERPEKLPVAGSGIQAILVDDSIVNCQ